MRVALFPTCVIDAALPDAGVATVKVLRRLGHEVDVPAQATCCGQPAWNSGHAEAAAQVARTTLDALEEADADVVLVPSGSCATMIRVFWPELFHLEGSDDDVARVHRLAGKTIELSEFLAKGSGPATVNPDATSTVYHRSCHMLRELRITDEPEFVLDRTGADRRVPAHGERCCGFGGLFSVKLPEVSVAMADDVLDDVVASGATRVVGCDASCLLHLHGRSDRRALGLEFEHLACVVDRTTTPTGADTVEAS